MIRALTIVALLAGTALPCAEPQLTDVPLTKDGTTIASGGGVVMMTVNGRGGGIDQDVGGGKLVAGTTDVTMRQDYLAPGLTVIVPRPQPKRAIELANGRGKILLGVVQGDVAPKHAAPKVERVTSTLPPTRRDDGAIGMYEPSSVLSILLAESPPDDVLALVVYQGAQGIAWVAPQKGQTSYRIYAGGKRCMPGPASVPQATKVSFGWVDLSGRVSLLAKEIRVGATPPEKQN